MLLFVLLALALTAIPAAGQRPNPTYIMPTDSPTQPAYPGPIPIVTTPAPYPAPPTGVDLVDLSAESNTPFVFGVALLVVAIAGLVAAGARRRRK
jgi:hypothetical protein